MIIQDNSGQSWDIGDLDLNKEIQAMMLDEDIGYNAARRKILNNVSYWLAGATLIDQPIAPIIEQAAETVRRTYESQARSMSYRERNDMLREHGYRWQRDGSGWMLTRDGAPVAESDIAIAARLLADADASRTGPAYRLGETSWGYCVERQEPDGSWTIVARAQTKPAALTQLHRFETKEK